MHNLHHFCNRYAKHLVTDATANRAPGYPSKKYVREIHLSKAQHNKVCLESNTAQKEAKLLFLL